jgi:hypothetical protein
MTGINQIINLLAKKKKERTYLRSFNLPNTLIELNLYGEEPYIPLSFIARLTNLQKMILSFDNQSHFEEFKTLQYVNFSQLQDLKFECQYPRNELLIKFLENNGKNLREFYVDNSTDNSLNLAVAKFCPNLRKLFIGYEINDIELQTLKLILKNCQYLERIKIQWDDSYLRENDLLHELRLSYTSNGSDLLPEELESFFISWKDRIPLSLILVFNDHRTLDDIDGNLEIIEKYTKLGIVREFDKVSDDYW